MKNIMKKNTRKKILSILIVVFTMLSINNCSEDDLLNKSPKDMISTGSYFVDASSARGAVVAIFSNWNKRYTMFQRGLMYLDLSTDDCYTRIGDPRGMFNTYEVDPYQSSNAFFNEWWEYIFRSINDANFCIDYIPTSSDTKFTEEQQKPYIAAARFMRAFGYIYLTSLFGDVPLHEKFISNPDDSYKARTPVDKVYDLIIEDLIYAKQNLPEKWPADDYGLPSKAAGAGLLARAYLYDKDFPNAEIAAKEAIEIADNSGYELIRDLAHFTFKTPYFPDRWRSFL